ncbi:MAG TPA: type II toxin-antitoxin system HicA family toxin [Thermoanaerobaculia bacterium]|nr:type II toxin-antitoxin system HicA family toxin [Thermoanaerobaculia bacterium]
MTRLPRPTGRQLIGVLRQLEFEVVRVRGSHHFLRHPDGRTTVVAVHAGETLGPGLLAKILRDVELNGEDLAALLGQR